MRQHSPIAVVLWTIVIVISWGIGIVLWLRIGLLVFNIDRSSSTSLGTIKISTPILYSLLSVLGLYLAHKLVSFLIGPSLRVYPVIPYFRSMIVGAVAEAIGKKSGLALLTGASIGLVVAMGAYVGASIAVNIEHTWATIQERLPRPHVIASLGTAFAVSLSSLAAYLIIRYYAGGVAAYVAEAIIIATLWRNIELLNHMEVKE